MQSSKKEKTLKRERPSSLEMMETDPLAVQLLDSVSIAFPVEKIVQYPLPGFSSPTLIGFSPDDKSLAYLFSDDHTLSRMLFLYDLKSGKEELFFSPPDGGLDENNLSAEEKLRRERLRERGLGVTRYEWVKTSSIRKSVMVPLPTGLYIQDFNGRPELKVLSTASSPIIDPHASPDGTMLAYVKDGVLHVLNIFFNESKQLTSGADGNNLTHGVAEYIAQEEMERKNGYWWSHDSKFLAFTEVDSSEVPLYRIMHQGRSSVGSGAQEDHAYPFAGAANVKVRLGVVSVEGGAAIWMDLLCGGKDGPHNDEEYLARVEWMYGNYLTAQVLNRSHSKLKILQFDIKTGQRKLLLQEEHETWINLHDCFTPLEKGLNKYNGGFVWASEKTGFRHLYLHDTDGGCVGPITQGDWMVEQVAGINEPAGVIYFTGTLDSPLETHLYSVKLFPEPGSSLEAPRRLTQGAGKHVVVLDHQLARFIDIHDSLHSPPTISLCSLHDGVVLQTVYNQQPQVFSLLEKLQIKSPEMVEIPAKDGTTLYGELYKPDTARFGPPPYKTMVQVYGGPSVQLACNSWADTVDMRAQYLRSKGILVWKMDNRGTTRRGLEFEGALKHKCGQMDAEDQLTGAEWLIANGLAQKGHIGLYGWSYGGYLSAMMLAKFPQTFRCAVSGAPVTSWDGYDTFYTEKYMGLPAENHSSYLRSSIMYHAGKIEGKLLLVHGMIDENVHFRHTARLVNALVAAGKPYELLIFPDERHMPRKHKDRLYLEQRILEFIDRNL